MCEDVLNRISQLESVYITKSELDVGVDDKFRKSEDFPTKMESIAETGLLSLFGGQCLDWLQVHILTKSEQD